MFEVNDYETATVWPRYDPVKKTMKMVPLTDELRATIAKEMKEHDDT